MAERVKDLVCGMEFDKDTAFFLTSWMGKSYPVLDPFSHSSGHLVLVFLGLAHIPVAMVILHIITNGLIGNEFQEYQRKVPIIIPKKF